MTDMATASFLSATLAPPAPKVVARQTVAGEVRISGTGIHSGAACSVTITPAQAGEGYAFSRGGGAPVVADWRSARADESVRRTVIVGADGQRFEQVEHLLAAFAAMGITDARVEQVGPEVPFLDGGSAVYMDELRAVGTQELDSVVEVLCIDRALGLVDGDAMMTATPDNALRLSCYVEFPGTVVGSAGCTLLVDEESFRREAAPARTFALAGDIEKLRAMGLAKGGNLENAVVFDHERYHNDSLRFPDEVARHKLIDLLGDLALLGRPLRGHFWAWRAGHQGHVRLAQRIAREYAL
jgi:UDP-3-O-[3-hydroxymyristoyl] N-acetylglucosamine deacetylase